MDAALLQNLMTGAAETLGKRAMRGIISARKHAALSAELRSDLRVERACGRPFFACESPRLSPSLVSRMAFHSLSGASTPGKGLRVGASFSRPSVPDRHYFHERKLSERVPFEVDYASPVKDGCSSAAWASCCRSNPHLLESPVYGPSFAVTQSPLAEGRCEGRM
jgi:hypothetical protein